MSGLDLFDRPSTADTGARNAGDYYETPAWMTRSLLEHHPIPLSARILEPCAGDGAIARALQQLGYRDILTNDLDPRHETTYHLDATSTLWQAPLALTADWVITNPPFTRAFPILVKAVPLATVGVAMLLRKTFLEPTQERGAWLAEHPPSRVIGLPRHNFRGKGSDSCAADWVIWEYAPRRLWPPFVIDHEAKSRKVRP